MSSPAILIQPTLENLDAYNRFADRHDLAFEVTDFASPDLLDGNADTVLAGYRQASAPSRLRAMHGPYLDLYINSPDAAIRSASQTRIRKALRIASELTVEFVVFHTNRLPMIGTPDYEEQWVEAHAAFWTSVTAHYDLTILLENMWDSTPEPLARVMERVDSTRLRVCFDTGHHHVFSDVPLDAWLERLGKHIAYLHLNDNPGDRDLELPPGEGTIDWRSFSELVKRHCDAPPAVLEVADLPGVEKSLQFIRAHRVYPWS